MSPPELPDFPSSQLFLRRLAYSLVHDVGQAEDLVQDTWTAWLEHGPRGLSEPRAWLARVLRNRAFNLQRGEKRRARREAEIARPDPGEPETDGTLEAQARLIEALRTLDEPYRSTLVQRYYHDLTPSAIAERSGTPLQTVKARLARGLERLRVELDRRYGGDRGAWCHWLLTLGRPAPVGLGTGSAAPAAGISSSTSVFGWIALLGVVAAGVVWEIGWPRTPEKQTRGPSEPVSRDEARVPLELRGEKVRAPVESKEPRVVRDEPVAPQPSAEVSAPQASSPFLTLSERPAGEREDFDWPQYAGSADHANFRVREDQIFAPRVLWFVPGCTGQPTLSDNDLYTGGFMLARIDPTSGAPLAAAAVSGSLMEKALALLPSANAELDKETMQKAMEDLDPEVLQSLLDHLKEQDPKNPALREVADAPVITRERVIARRTSDGGVDAFDRTLAERTWSWTPQADQRMGRAAREVPLCLASQDVVLVPAGLELVALNVKDGSEAWRFAALGRMSSQGIGFIETVPACADGWVFFGLAEGGFYALDLRTGRQLWQASISSFRETAPVVVEARVLCVEHEPLGEHGRLRAFDVRSGRELWATELGGAALSLSALPPARCAVGSLDQEMVRIDLATGHIDPLHRLQTGAHALGSPTVVGKSLVSCDLDGHLYVHDFASGKLRWAFQAPNGAQVQAFVHTGKRIYVATSIGLFCIGDDAQQTPPADGWVLQWSGDTSKASYPPSSPQPEEK